MKSFGYASILFLFFKLSLPSKEMTKKPKCMIVTGRAGSGKTTLAKLLGKTLWMPVVSRDEIKEGYVNTFGVKHDKLPTDTDKIVTDLFFHLVNQYLAGKVSLIIEAAFQHKVWEPKITQIAEIAEPFIIICSLDDDLAARRHLQRGLDEPKRTFYHSDKRVSIFHETGTISPPAPYEPPNLAVPTIRVSTDDGYSPNIEEIIEKLACDLTRPL